ncbi:DUF2794 domain-containing protein [Rhizobiales bacterium]|uniref:DUF2794 domain-containing protein n=1 Tax=Hongsoonwoonella zoysiae TaxID=2821844 RepID=UPI0015601194|nr:DUF2794 domain-containing protein [Hongsoonwoonella zoysiae]NRG17138.1 DUF2794 domain-containing protein [Hongsoonwoonella zoysiae]
MSEFDEDALSGGAPASVEAGYSPVQRSAPPAQRAVPLVAFHRRELDQILRLYGRMVASGEWRDYAIDHMKEKAVFSVFRRTSEMPLFRIEKVPKNARRQGAYAVIGAGGAILKRGSELAQVLKVFEKKRHLRLVDA